MVRCFARNYPSATLRSSHPTSLQSARFTDAGHDCPALLLLINLKMIRRIFRLPLIVIPGLDPRLSGTMTA